MHRLFNFDYNCLLFRRRPKAIKIDCVGRPLISSIPDFVVEPASQLIYKILQNDPAFAEGTG